MVATLSFHIFARVFRNTFGLLFWGLFFLEMGAAPYPERYQMGLSDLGDHPFHASICHIEHNAGNKTLEISIQLFADDLDLALTQVYGQRYFVGTPAEREGVDDRLFDYLKKNFFLTVNGTPATLTFIGKESRDNANFELWCYLEVPNVSHLSQLAVTNTLLIERFNDQSNLIKVKANGKKESLHLNTWKQSGALRFD